MTRNGNRRHKAGHASVRRRIPTDRLDAMIEEAIVDAYTESEQAVGFHATVEQHLHLPFETVLSRRSCSELPSPSRRSMSRAPARSSPSAAAGASDRPSRFSIFHCRIHRQPVGNGSRRIGGGREDAGGENR